MSPKIYLFLFQQYVIYIQCVFSAYIKEGKPCTISEKGIKGICMEAEKCISAKYDFENLHFEPTLCDVSTNKVFVCCSDNATNSSKEINNSPLKDPIEKFLPYHFDEDLRISEKKCHQYSSLVMESFNVYSALPQSEAIPINIEKCDFVSNQLIVGGKNAKQGQFPHMALLGWISENSNEYEWKCGGTLISEYFVLTATHCTFHKAYANPKPSVVRLGEHNLNSRHNIAKPQDIQIQSIILHPEFKPGKKYHDIALLRLKNSIEINKYIRPACLWNKPILEEKTAIISGWGATEYGGVGSSILQYAAVDIISNKNCNDLFSKSTDKRVLDRGIIDDQLCAGKLEGGRDTCQGDSGGPIQIVSKTNNCIYYIIGITSFGSGCGAANLSAIYTRVDRYLNWIENEVWPNEN